MKANKAAYPIYYEEIPYRKLDDLIALFADKDDLSLLISASTVSEHGRYSYLCFDAFGCFKAKKNHFLWNEIPISLPNPFDFVQEKLDSYPIKQDSRLPPFQGGAVGYFSYEAAQYLEKISSTEDTILLPDIHLYFYGTLLAQDKQTKQLWIMATGFPEKTALARKQRALNTIARLKTQIKNQTISPASQHIYHHQSIIQSNFSKQSYMQAVDKIKAYIREGDIFQTNLSQQFSGSLPPSFDTLDFYRFLMQQAPAPYSAFLRLQEGCVISSSPERFLKLSQNQVETCPIKGTCKRATNPIEDAALAHSLTRSEKNRAENIMIVDLMRNDLARVCLAGSVKVQELCSLQSFPNVHHLVSKISGQLQPNVRALDLLKATFPPGSITGAPKIRAMQIISELERYSRGPYCGALGYLSFTGDIDLSVSIRTFFTNNQGFFFAAGGAVILDSNSEEEFLETLTKSKAFREIFAHDFTD